MRNAKLLGTRPGQTALRAAAAMLLIAAVLLLVVRLPAEAQENDRDVSGVTLTSPNPGELVITWDAPGKAPTDYRVTWKKSDGKWPSHRSENTIDGGNAFPTGTSHAVAGLEEGTAYKARVRARYFDGNGNVEESGPWSAAEEIAVAQTPPPAKATGLLTAASYDNVLLSWDNPDDDSITGYQVLRGPDADNLAVLLDDTGSATSSYTDSAVAAEKTYVYAVRGRNARGLSPQSDPVTATTLAPPEEDDPPTSARALAGEDFTLDGKELDTDDANCLEDTIGDVTDDCTINIDTTTAIFAVDGTLDSNDRLSIKIGRDKAAVDAASAVVDHNDLVGTDDEETLTFQVGRNLMRLWGDEDGDGGSSSEEHFYRVNVLPYWELNSDRLSKSDDCRSTSDRTAAQITDDDCIVTQFSNTAIIQFHNVITDQFNVYVWVNETRVIDEPDDTDLAGSFTLDLQDGGNAVRVRLASKTGSHFSEEYGNDKFHYKVETGVLVSNLGQVSSGSGLENPLANQFTTGSNPSGYIISKVGLKIAGDSGTVPRVSIYSDNSGRPGTSLKVLTNPSTIPPGPAPEDVIDFGADNYRLEPGTPYWIVVEKASGNEPMYLGRTTLTAEDPGSAAGWSIGDNGARLASGTWSTLTAIYGLAVKGTIAASDDATLSALALRDASDNAVALDPTFASGTTSYTATVAYSVSRIKVEPTTNDSGATIEYLDDSDMTLDDEDASTADVFDFDLSVGSNVVKVKVTAEDRTTTRTYTITVNRVDFLVSNLGESSHASVTIQSTDTDRDVAIQFTTGSETNGYRISKVALEISASSGTIPRVSIYSDSSGQPGSSLKVLTNPGAIPTTRTELDFGADNYRLNPSTPYWIVVERASGIGGVFLPVTNSLAEDPGSAVGWNIGDNGSSLSGGTWRTVTGLIAIPQIAVKGTVAQTAASDDATLSAMTLKDANDYAVTLTPGFASSTTSYTATVANSISRIKVEPTANDSNATIEYLDDSDSTLDDADANTAVFDFVLVEGANIIKVKVTAEDHTTTRTYTVTVTRAAATTPVAPASDDATLSALALRDASDNAVTLDPTFASGTTSYTATVANSVSRIKAEPTANDSNAAIEYLDASDSTLDDADANTAVFDFDLTVGSNVVKVKVTAEDGTTTRTYTVTVIRETLNNQGATGAPTITGTASVHQTLTAVTTNISDADGLTGPSFSYQWIRVDTDGSESEISGAVSSTYKLTGDDEGKKLKVRVSFNDDNDNPEFLTSAATAAVSPSPCTMEGALRFNGSLPAIDVVIGDSDGTTVTLPSWSGPVCRALFYLGYSNSEDVDVFRADGRTSITSVTFNGMEFSVDQETRELTIRTTNDLPSPWNSDIEFWDTLETYMLVPLDNWGSTEESQFQGKDIFVRFHNLAAPNLHFSRDGRTVRFSGGADYSTDLYPGRPFNAGGYEIQRCDTSGGCASDSDWTRVVRTANGQSTDWSLNRTDNVPSATSAYRYRARQHITLRHDGSTYYGPWSSEVLLRAE